MIRHRVRPRGSSPLRARTRPKTVTNSAEPGWIGGWGGCLAAGSACPLERDRRTRAQVGPATADIPTADFCAPVCSQQDQCEQLPLERPDRLRQLFEPLLQPGNDRGRPFRRGLGIADRRQPHRNHGERSARLRLVRVKHGLPHADERIDAGVRHVPPDDRLRAGGPQRRRPPARSGRLRLLDPGGDAWHQHPDHNGPVFRRRPRARPLRGRAFAPLFVRRPGHRPDFAGSGFPLAFGTGAGAGPDSPDAASLLSSACAGAGRQIGRNRVEARIGGARSGPDIARRRIAVVVGARPGVDISAAETASRLSSAALGLDLTSPDAASLLSSSTALALDVSSAETASRLSSVALAWTSRRRTPSRNWVRRRWGSTSPRPRRSRCRSPGRRSGST